MKGRLKLVCLGFVLVISHLHVTKAQDNTVEIPEGNYDNDGNQLVNNNDEHNAKVAENRMAAQLYAVIEHYKQPNPVGIPGADIPDPMDVPDVRKSLGMATLNMMEVKMYGLSKFRVTSIKANLKEMSVDTVIELEEMVMKGTYTLNSLFSKATGPFKVVIKKLVITGLATLTVERNGRLTTDQIKMDIGFGDMSTNFENLGFLGSVFQSVVNSAPTLVFDAMKPFMMQEADKKLRGDINMNIEKLMGERKLPNSITPLDMAIAEGRKKVRLMGYDPFHIPDYNRTVGILSMKLANTWIWGVASFYRVGDMIISMENNTISLLFQVGTQQISGAGQWEVGCGLMTRVGHVQFTVEHIRVTVGVSQPMDTRLKPKINDLKIDLGNIQVRSDGAGTLDYIMEFVVNVLPNLLRYQIMDALENPIKMRIQEKFNQIDVEKAIKENFEKFESMGKDFSFDFKM